VPVGAGWQGVASEGGHVSFGPGAADEEAVFARLRAAHGPVSAETMLCGPGLERLFAAMHPAEKPRAAAAIVAGATADDAAAHACLTLFVRLLGRFAGDLALTFKALGGVYIGGGVAPRIAAFLDAPAWRAAFEAHPPYAALLRRIPTLLITHEEPGLLGCAAVARAQGLA
jgi:glucokinase